MIPESVPKKFQQTVSEVYGERGVQWLRGLPDLIADCEGRWDLRVLAPFELSYNYVTPAVRSDGMPVILKLGVPNPELTSEIQALQCFDGRGAARLLEGYPEEGIVLLERLLPGRPLEHLDDDRQATSIAAQLMRRLWRQVPLQHPFIPLDQWTAGLKRLRVKFNGDPGPFPEKMVARAEGLISELLASSSQRVLLHGDLHHWNILSAQRQDWLAIDPKGLVGDPAFEVGAWLLNPKPRNLSGDGLKHQLHRRLDQFADELELKPERLKGWGFALAMLSAWWSYEDHGYGWEHALEIAKILLNMV